MQQLSDQIDVHYLRTRPEEELQLKKEKLYHYIQECAHKLQLSECDENDKNRVLQHIATHLIHSSTWKLFRFGSECDGTSLPSSDIDLGVHVNFRNSRKDKENLLYKLSRIISRNDIDESLLVKLILRARYPIVKVHDIYTRCTVNISIADRYCYQRHELMKQYINYYNSIYCKIFESDECIKKLIVFIKYWSKRRDINNAYHGYLNSFGFMLFIVKFLKWFTMYKLYANKQWNLGDLLKEFYTFYVAYFDETKHSISIIDHFYDYDDYDDFGEYDEENMEMIFDDKLDRNCVLEVIDPVNNRHNVTKNVGFNEFEHIKYEFIRSLQIFENNKNDLFDKLCKSTKESLAKYDINGRIHYGTFIYSKTHDKDLRYKYDKNVHWTLTKIQ